jgi:mannan endo-1,4-beta-mannosidase
MMNGRRLLAVTVTVVSMILGGSVGATAQDFVVRSRDTLWLGTQPFFFLGANAYPLMVSAARGDTQSVCDLFGMANAVGITVIRTWAFYDSSDSLDSAVVQVRPGKYNERALRGLDYVLLQARLHGIRILLPLVNNWDDYGGMNQYVRWRREAATAGGEYVPGPVERSEVTPSYVRGPGRRQYRVSLGGPYEHDIFYTDSLIRVWFTNFATMLVQRTNTLTGVRYVDDPTVVGWELANEPRSSDPTGTMVYQWVGAVARLLRGIDPHHLLGTGEEGFDVSPDPYTATGYNDQGWLFDGAAGVSFSRNSAVPEIDLAGSHLYPDYWGLPYSSGTVWIADHRRIARNLAKPLILGEFGARVDKPAAYDSWLNTMLYDGAMGGCVWQLLVGAMTDPEGFGIRCPEDETLCSVLSTNARLFRQKCAGGLQPAPLLLHVDVPYPNPGKGLATISYSLPQDAVVVVEIYNALGQRVLTVDRGMQTAGSRKELLDLRTLPSEIYFYTLRVTPAQGVNGSGGVVTGKFVVLH